MLTVLCAIGAREFFVLFMLWEAQSRILRRIAVSDTGCWIWLGANDGRYGHVKFHGRRYKAHRFAYMLWRKWKLRDAFLLHQCDVVRCCCPFHTNEGDKSMNLREAWQRARRRHAGCAVPRVSVQAPF